MAAEQPTGKVEVVVRIRPLGPTQLEESIFQTTKSSVSINYEQLGKRRVKKFEYDHLVDSRYDNGSQHEIANIVVPIVVNCVQHGVNTCLLAYGQTSSGKSYTMTGVQNNLGLIPRIAEKIFAEPGVQVYAQHIEIYNDKVFDLFTDDPHEIFKQEKTQFVLSSSQIKKTQIEQQQFKQLRGNIQKSDLPGLDLLKICPDQGHITKQLDCSNPSTVILLEDFYDLTQALIFGMSRRTTAETEYNEFSSRSHSILTLFVKIKRDQSIVSSQLSLVDLAGSERLDPQMRYDQLRVKETNCISASLTNLGIVIRAVVSGQQHIPYRSNVLTRCLQNSLNQKIVFIANVSPAVNCTSETIQTLVYARQMKMFSNDIKFNVYRDVEVIQIDKQQYEEMEAMVQRLTKENSELYSQIDDIRRELHQYIGNPAELQDRSKLLELKNRLEAVRHLKNFDSSQLGDILDDGDLDNGEQCMVVRIQNEQQRTYKLNFGDYLQFGMENGQISVIQRCLSPEQMVRMIQHQDAKVFDTAERESAGEVVLMQMVALTNRSYVFYYTKNQRSKETSDSQSAGNSTTNFCIIQDEAQIILDDNYVIYYDYTPGVIKINSISMLARCMELVSQEYRLYYQFSERRIGVLESKNAEIQEVSVLQFVTIAEHYIKHQEMLNFKTNNIQYIAMGSQQNERIALQQCVDERQQFIDANIPPCGSLQWDSNNKLVVVTLSGAQAEITLAFWADVAGTLIFRSSDELYYCIRERDVYRIYGVAQQGAPATQQVTQAPSPLQVTEQAQPKAEREKKRAGLQSCMRKSKK